MTIRAPKSPCTLPARIRTLSIESLPLLSPESINRRIGKIEDRAGLCRTALRSEPFCTVFPKEMSEAIYVFRERLIRQTRRATHLLRHSLPRQGGSRAMVGCFVSRNPQPGRLPVEGTSSGPASMACPKQSEMKMHGEYLRRADHFSEVVLLGGEVMFVSLLLIVVATLMRA
jgi:hypothetical protein